MKIVIICKLDYARKSNPSFPQKSAISPILKEKGFGSTTFLELDECYLYVLVNTIENYDEAQDAQ